MKKVFATGLGVAVLSLGSLALNQGNAQAATISYNANLFTSTTKATTGTANFLKFDSALGTLTGVTISSDLTGTATLKAVNQDSVAQDFTDGFAQFTMTLSSSLGGSTTGLVSSGNINGIAAANSTTSFSGSPVNAGISLSNPSLSLAAYIGDGTSTFIATGKVSSGSYGGTADSDLLSFGGTSLLSSKATVTYTYTATPSAAVPEPLTILGAATAVGFGVAFKRRGRGLKNNKKA